MTDEMIQYGSAEHAADITVDRQPATRDAMQWLTFRHLPPNLQAFSAPFFDAAVSLLKRISADSPELTSALNGLIAAKDHAMRAGIKSDTGRAGAVPRPQKVVAPPVFS
jgi:hypothetical protein